MTNFFKSSIISSLGLAILGILLIFYSEVTIVSISYVIGAILIALGTLALLKYIRNYKVGIQNGLDIVYGIVTVILGIIIITNPKEIAGIIPFVIGIVIIISSANKLQYSFELKKVNSSIWKSTMILSIITMLCGILLIFNPFKGAVFITKIVGILILLYAVLDLISTIAIKKSIKEINGKEEKIKEADVIEDKSKKKKQKKLANEKNKEEVKEAEIEEKNEEENKNEETKENEEEE